MIQRCCCHFYEELSALRARFGQCPYCEWVIDLAWLARFARFAVDGGEEDGFGHCQCGYSG